MGLIPRSLLRNEIRAKRVVGDTPLAKRVKCPGDTWVLAPGRFIELLPMYGISRSMSRVGTPTDNAAMEAINGWINAEFFYGSARDWRQTRSEWSWWLHRFLQWTTSGLLAELPDAKTVPRVLFCSFVCLISLFGLKHFYFFVSNFCWLVHFRILPPQHLL